MPPAATAMSATPSYSQTISSSSCSLLLRVPLRLHRHMAHCQSDVFIVHLTEADVLNKLVSESVVEILGNSFWIEIGSVNQQRASSESGRRSYSIGSLDYIVDEEYKVSVRSTHHRRVSDCTEKDCAGVPVSQPEPQG
ncbi:hypothetical protein RJ639_012875 [Escallonia herrerae]|uniref:Uncharacterized protein n=1 Tax=Escallonia herrerae TaxID=1293975 RepID=A0AA88VKR3_9ASTE|nr:hypothetical protein RJ639_012875 [Escallonia herrerae]